MSIFKIFLCFLSIVLFSNASVQAQNSPQGVLNLLNNQIQECTADIEFLESKLSKIEGVNTASANADRKLWTKGLESIRKCRDQTQKELNVLKAFYPSLFMPPATIYDNNTDRNHEELRILAAQVEDAFNKLTDLFGRVSQQVQNLLDGK